MGVPVGLILTHLTPTAIGDMGLAAGLSGSDMDYLGPSAMMYQSGW